MIKSVIAALLLMIMTSAPALARLGETPEQCNQRYGAKYTEKGGEGFWTAERIYEINGIQLSFRFLPAQDGTTKAAYVDYKPLHGKMSEVQIQTLLETVAKDWAPLTELRDEKKTESKVKAEADQTKRLHGNNKKIITIESSAGADKRKLEREEKERKEYLETLASKNKNISENQNRIQSAVTWYGSRSGEALSYWIRPNAFAGSSPQRVVIFTSEYLRQHEKGAETNTGKINDPPQKSPEGFKGF